MGLLGVERRFGQGPGAVHLEGIRGGGFGKGTREAFESV